MPVLKPVIFHSDILTSLEKSGVGYFRQGTLLLVTALEEERHVIALIYIFKNDVTPLSYFQFDTIFAAFYDEMNIDKFP